MKLEKFKKITPQKYFVGISSFIFGGIYAIFLLIINDPTFGDYRFFANEPVSIFYGFTRWQTWSSRLFIENAVNLFSKNLFVWAIITIFLSGLLFWSLSRILKIRRIEQPQRREVGDLVERPPPGRWAPRSPSIRACWARAPPLRTRRGFPPISVARRRSKPRARTR